MLEHINCETGEIFTLEGIYHGLEDGDHIVFEDFEQQELNELNPIPIKTTASELKTLSFQKYNLTFLEGNIMNVGQTLAQYKSMLEAPLTRGRAKQVKVPKNVAFKSLAEALKEPEILIWDFAKFDEPAQLHFLWQALYQFEKKVCTVNKLMKITANFKHGRSPKPRSNEDAQLLKNELPSNAPEIPDNLLNNFSYQVCMHYLL